MYSGACAMLAETHFREFCQPRTDPLCPSRPPDRETALDSTSEQRRILGREDRFRAAPPAVLHWLEQQRTIAAAESEKEANLMDQGILISSQVLFIFGVLGNLLVGLAYLAVELHFRRLHRYNAELLAAYKQTSERIAECHRAIVGRLDPNKAEVLELNEQSDERSKDGHRDIQAALRDLSYRVGRLEGAGGVPADAAPRSGRHSQRRGDNPSPGIDGEPEPSAEESPDPAG